MKKLIFLAIFILFSAQKPARWGFFAHQFINKTAIFLLPPEMFGFYKFHLQYLAENAVNPDKRRYAVEGEAPKHYIDLDVYGDSAVWKMPRYWKQAVEFYCEDTLLAYGIVPWHLQHMKYRLTEAFKERNAGKILAISADLGHYIGDANVPLHTTENYNGQKTNQYGIHGFWESRLPELFYKEYDFFFENKANYLKNTQLEAWRAVMNAHFALDSVFRFEKELTKEFGDDRKYSFETRNGMLSKVYSREFSTAYHDRLNGQVERQMRSAIQMVADFWFTCWVDAGQPNLDQLLNENFEPDIESDSSKNEIVSRPHENE
ncbi:MAG: S1/P1 Nuclease [Bacteroidetes bacterium]|nr:MAG: S1/P1 Nuclease [Bacteroidota bacterium]